MDQTPAAGWTGHMQRLARRTSLLKYLVVFNLAILQIFFPLKKSKTEKIYKRDIPAKLGSQFRKGRSGSQGGGRPVGKLSAGSETEEAYSTYRLIEARSGLPQIDVYLKYYYAFCFYYNIWMLIKHLLVTLMRSPTFARIRFLDCFLLGRFVVNGRVIEVASSCACFLLLAQLGWFSELRFRRDEMRLPCFEFLLKTPAEVSQWSMPRATSLRDNARRTTENKLYGTDQRLLHSTVFEFRNPFEVPSNDCRFQGQTFKTRPSRTLTNWARLSGVFMHYNLAFFSFFSLVVIFFIRMCMPIAISRQGYESNYRFCLQWLKSDNRTSVVGSQLTSTKSFFFNLVQPSPDGYARSGFSELSHKTQFKIRTIDQFWMPFGKLVPFNYYHTIRVFFDILDTSLLYGQTVFTMSAMGLVSVTLINDVIIYASDINRRLRGHVGVLRDLSDKNLAGPLPGSNRLSRAVRPHNEGSEALQDAAVDIQAQIVDAFATLKMYQYYLGFQSVWLVTLWLSYSALVTSWLFLPGQDAPKIEWFLVHGFATFFLFLFMAQFEKVKMGFIEMYKLMTIAAALDGDYKFNKLIWLSLLRFYAPIPLYCFTFISKIHIDLMFGLKLVAWLASALIIAASFFTVYQ